MKRKVVFPRNYMILVLGKAAALAIILHAAFLFLVFWLGGATGAPQVQNQPQFISVSLDHWLSGGESGKRDPILRGKIALPPGSAAWQNKVSTAVRTRKEVREKNLSQESGGLAGEENHLEQPAAGGDSLSSEAGLGQESGTTEGITQGAQPEVLARPLYEMNPQPLYPHLARRMGKQGIVLLEVFVSASGRVAEVKVATGSGYEILDEAALSTVRGWRFSPGRRNGQPAAMWVRVPVRFELRG